MVIEKVNQYHPDKVADRIAGAIVDYAYTLQPNPRIAVEVLVGHGHATIIAETSVILERQVVEAAVGRIAGLTKGQVELVQVPQDSHLALNQAAGFRCGDNGVFAAKWNSDYERATELAAEYGSIFLADGKYLFDFKKGAATICQSNAANHDIAALVTEFDALTINPLGAWTGGTDTDTGATNRKLGSDQPLCNPNGLHGKDLSKADVTITICLNAISRILGGALVQAYCSIGDVDVPLYVGGKLVGTLEFTEAVEYARGYIDRLGGFEQFATYGIQNRGWQLADN